MQAKTLIRKLKAIGLSKKGTDSEVSRKLSIHSFSVLKQELSTALRVHRYISRQPTSTITHFDCVDREKELAELKKDYEGSPYILKTDVDMLTEVVSLNNVRRKGELIQNEGWVDTLDEEPIENEEQKPELGCFELLLIRLGLKKHP